MSKYRKKPVIIDAIQLTSESLMDCISFIYPDISVIDHQTLITIRKNKFLYIETLEGDMKAQFGDYIIKGVQGEFYLCKPDIFEVTYEKVE
ncbi:hypothetical protein D9K80_15560 [Acinetobacter cumulans]|uniref:Uncharacterized protein n=1 Tax=Acinetobacter cumulans TaxID=2136182 RepID=A0A498CWU8_9GAMM|nr:hypothetical protein [Acinetobacter cumulans]RLL30722.1 hypothetical protein D9K80_15560 [Acinetobacter cumulans]